MSFSALNLSKVKAIIDIDKEAVEFVKSKGINAFVSDLFQNVNGKFDLIIFNPPYLPEDQDEDDETALQVSGGKKGNEIFERFIKQAASYMKHDGKILTLISDLTPDAEKIVSENGFNYEVLETQKLFMEELKVLLIFR